MPPKECKRIVIGDDGSATYTRTLSLPGETGADPPRERTMETKTVDMDALFPEEGQLILYPPGCRYAKRQGAFTVFAIEVAPQVRSLNWATSGTAYARLKESLLSAPPRGRRPDETESAFRERLQRQSTFRIAFPYLVFILRFNGPQVDSSYAFHRNATLRDGNDELYRLHLPNQKDGLLCLTERAKTLSANLPMAEAASIILEEFWMGWWNDHWMDRFLAFGAKHPAVGSPWDWEDASAKDPAFALKIPWDPAGTTLGSFVRSLLAETAETSAFDGLVRRVQAADAWTGGSRAPQGKLRNSPSVSLALQTGEIRIGQYLIPQAETLPQLPVGEGWAIEWFGLADGAGNREVKLAGIERPLPVIRGNRLLQGLAVSDRPPTPPPSLDGTVLRHGTRVWFHDRSLWPNLPTAPISIVRAEMVQDGQIGVLLPRQGGLVVIGKDGRTLPGVLIVDPDAEGLLRWDAAHEGSDAHLLLEIGRSYSFFAPEHGIVSAELEYFHFDEGAGAMAQLGRIAVPLRTEDVVWLSADGEPVRTPTRTPLAPGTHVAHHGSLVPIEQGFQKILLTFVRIRKSWHLVDNDKIQRLPWIQDDELRGFAAKAALAKIGDVIDPLSIGGPAPEDGSEVRIAGLQADEATKLPFLVLSNGWLVAATAGNLARLRRRRPDAKKWLPLRKEDLGRLPRLPGHDFRPPASAATIGEKHPSAPGVRVPPLPGSFHRVRYLGGGKAGLPTFDEERAKQTPATIVAWRGDRICRLRFDRSFPGLDMDTVAPGRVDAVFTWMGANFLSVDAAPRQTRIPGV